VLLRARLVEPPKLAFRHLAISGGRDSLHVGDETIRITDQPGLQASEWRWRRAAGCPQ
jgi:defect in organelle trafficking protein DotC